MSGQHPPIETDPLGAIRKELLSAAWRQKARRDRNRRLATVTASIAMLLATATAGASAIGVDVPWVSYILSERGEMRDRAIEEGGPHDGVAPPASPDDLAQVPQNATEPLDLASEAGLGARGGAYLNTRGDICTLLNTTLRADTANVGGCTAPAVVRSRVDEGVVYVLGVTGVEDAVVISGYVSSDVTGVEAQGPTGSLTASLSEPWRPGGEGSPLRVFFAVGPRPSDSADLSTDGAERWRDPRTYEVRARLQDGRSITVRP